MDQQISRWIIEFLLRQHVDDKIMDRILSVLPLDDDDSRLKKALLLRRIQTEVTSATVSEKILELLELVGELDFREGKTPSETMKAAYCAVAVDCTVNFLGLGDNAKYLETLKRLWEVRARKMEKSENPGLISERLWSWRDDLEAASCDSELRDNILSRNTRNEALKAVRVYLAESSDEIGPSFIENTAENVVIMGKAGHGINEHEEEQGSEGSDIVIVETIPSDIPETQQKQGPQAGANRGRSRKAFHGTRSEVRITNIEEVDIDTSMKKYDTIPTPEVDRIKADLKSSFADLRAVVRDPLPEALRIAEGVVSDMHRDRGLGGNNGGEMHGVSASMDKTERTRLRAIRVEYVGGSDDRPEQEDCMNGCDSSRMVPNPSSNSDSLEFSELPARPSLCSPNRKKISPLKKYEMKKLTRRRPIKKWSVLEEDMLRDGVKKFGRGNWKVILDAYRDIFEERTDVDLKDKWRNLARYTK